MAVVCVFWFHQGIGRGSGINGHGCWSLMYSQGHGISGIYQGCELSSGVGEDVVHGVVHVVISLLCSPTRASSSTLNTCKYEHKMTWVIVLMLNKNSMASKYRQPSAGDSQLTQVLREGLEFTAWGRRFLGGLVFSPIHRGGLVFHTPAGGPSFFYPPKGG